MSRCTCNNPCTCYFEYDGDRPNTPYTLPYQNGRYSTRKTGTGTANDPYIIEFMDSEEFQVEAGQIRSSFDQLPASSNSSAIALKFDVVDYDTPTEIFLATDIHLLDGSIYPNYHRFWFMSAEATFIYAGSVSGTRRIHVQWHPPSAGYGNVGAEWVVAGNSITQITEDTTISCSGLIPFVNLAQDYNFYGPGGYLTVQLQQNSGATMTVRGVKLTLVAV